MVSTLVGHCPACMTCWEPYPGKGSLCECEGIGKWRSPGLLKRRMWKCSHEDCYEDGGPTYFFTQEACANHERAMAEDEAGGQG